ncbi:TRAP transporter small permease [Phaeobacter sp. C3_T13_0]|uniref:TRAP transporter small permease n=1 Tax=Phaeobacter cretensis TaxID=3342641 RepID=UPI0039BCF4BF
MLHKIVDKVEWALEKSAALMCLVLLVCLFTEVLTRYVFFTSIPEIQYIVPFCFLWMVMFASAIAVRKGTHFEVDLLQTSLSGLAKRIHCALMLLMVMAGGLIIARSSIDFVQLGLLKKSPATGIRMIYIYASLLIGGGLIALMALEQLFACSDDTPDDIDTILDANKAEISAEDLT